MVFIMSPGYPFTIRSKSQTSSSQGHKVQKYISAEGDRVCTLSTARRLVRPIK